MRMTIKQKREFRNIGYCKEYFRHDWDGCSAADYFCSHSSIDPTERYWGKPSGEPFDGLRQIAVAENDIHSLLVHYAYQKDQLIDKLEKIISSELIVPINSKEPETYKEVYLNRANEILTKIKFEAFAFQKPTIKRTGK